VTTLYDPVQHRFLSFVYGDDPRLLALGLTSWTLWRLGHPDQALACSRRARAAAEELDVPYGRTAAGIWTAALHHYRGEVEDAEQRAAEALALATRHGFEVNVAQATILHGWALVKQGERIVEGIADMRRGLAVYRTCRHELSQPVFLAMLADAYGRIGDADQGLGAIDDALDTISRTGERHYEAECWRLKGELCLKVAARQPGVDIEGEARASFHRAVDVARAQGARSWELRALTSLCRLERRCGGGEEPRRQLHDLCEAFTEGRNTRDWRDANDVRREPLAAARAVGSASETAREARSDQ